MTRDKRIVRGAIWDIDGTIIDSMPIWRDIGARYLRRQGLVPEAGLGDILFPMTISEGINYLRSRYGLKEAEQDIRDGLMKEISCFYREQVPAKDGVKDILAFLNKKSIPMALATVGDPDLGKAALSRLGLDRYFRLIRTCDQLGTSKKEPCIFLECAKLLGSKPEETLVFEDVYHAVHTVHEAGFIVAAVEDEESRDRKGAIMAEADLYISSYKDPHVKKSLEEWIDAGPGN